MNDLKTCPDCGSQLPPDAPGGQCPVCAARMLEGLFAGQALALEADPLPADTAGALPAHIRYLGDYELLEEIAAGGMGIIYRARQVSLNRDVAVKMIRGGARATPEMLLRFRSETEAIAHLAHPHIVTIFEVGEQEGIPYFSMEYVRGRSLADLAREQPLPPRQAASYLKTVAEAMHYAHERGVFHRDLKPANVLIDGNDEPRITDFGVAKLISGESSAAEATRTGVVLGTPGYLSPELARGDVNATSARSDVYGLGAVLYAVLSSRAPFAAADAVNTIRLVLEADAVPLRRLNPDVPRDLETICHKCLEKEPARRYASAQELAADLGRFLRQEPVTARPISSGERVWRWCRRRPARAAGLASVAGLCVALGVGLSWVAARTHRYEQHLQAARDARAPDRLAGWSAVVKSHVLAAGRLSLNLDETVRREYLAAFGDLDVREVAKFTNETTAAAFAPDGRLVTAGTGSRNGGRSLLVETNGAATELGSFDDGPVGWSPDGDPWQFTVRSNGIERRNLGTNTTNFHLPLPADEEVLNDDGHWRLAATTDGGLLAAALGQTNGSLGRVLILNGQTGERLGELSQRTNTTALAFSPDGSLLAVGDDEGRISVVSIPSLASVRVIPPLAHRGASTALAFGRDPLIPYDDNGDTNRWLLAAGDQSGGLVVWDLNRGLPRANCVGSDIRVLSLAFQPGGQLLASSGRSEVRLWEFMTGHLVLRIPTRPDTAWAVTFDSTGTRLAYGAKYLFSPGGTMVFRLQSEPAFRVMRGLTANSQHVWFSDDNRWVAAMDGEWHLGIWDIATGQLGRVFEAPVGKYTDNVGGAFDPTGKRFAMTTFTKAYLYDLDTGAVLRRWRLDPGFAENLAYDRAGRLLLLRREFQAGLNGVHTWRLWELGEGDQPIPVHKQTDPDMPAFQTFLPREAERFVVTEARTNPIRTAGLRFKLLATSDGRELLTVTTERTNVDVFAILDPTGRWFGYSPDRSPTLLRIMDLAVPGEKHTEKKRELIAMGPGGLTLVAVDKGEWVVIDPRWRHSQVGLRLNWRGALRPVFSLDGHYLTWGTKEGPVVLADLEELQRRLDDLDRAVRGRGP